MYASVIRQFHQAKLVQLSLLGAISSISIHKSSLESLKSADRHSVFVEKSHEQRTTRLKTCAIIVVVEESHEQRDGPTPKRKVFLCWRRDIVKISGHGGTL